MKRKLLTLTLILSLGAIGLSACGTKEVVKQPGKGTSTTISKNEDKKESDLNKKDPLGSSESAENVAPSEEPSEEYVDPFEGLEDDVEEDLRAIVHSIYDKAGQENYPESVFIMPLYEDSMEYNLGTNDLPGFEAGVVSDPMMSSIAHSLCVLRFDTAANAKTAAGKLLETAPVSKWVCVSAEKVATEIVDDRYVVFVMSSENFVNALDLSNVTDASIPGFDPDAGFAIPVPIN